MRREAKHPFLVGTVILGFLSIFMKRQASSSFEALNLARPLTCQMDVRRPFQKSRRPRAFSNISTGGSDIPSSCEMKDDPAFKPLEGNLAFFWVRASRGSIPIKAENTESLSHTYCWGKAPLEVLVESWLTSSVKEREWFLSWDDMCCTEHSSSCCTEIDDPQYLRWVSQLISGVS